MRQLIPLSASVVTIIAMWLAGNNNYWAWILGLFNQMLWVTFMVVFDAWGLFPLTLVLIFVYFRNLRKARRTLCKTKTFS